MQITSPNAASSQSGNQGSAAAKASMDYDAFLQLLIAQMQNQHPTSPMDPTEQMAQLASFSVVEQGLQTNAKLDALLTSAALSQADSVIGRTVTSPDGKTNGKVVALSIVSGGAVAVLADGKEVPLGAGVRIT